MPGDRSGEHGPSRPPAVEPSEVEPEPNPTIYDVMVTNLRDVAFSVTWRTDQPSTGWISLSDAGGGPEASAEDDRGAGIVSTLHQVTITNLTPETTYTFRVHSGDSVADHDGNGQPFQAVTLATTSPGVPLTAFGQVLDSDGQPAAGALVRAWLVNADQTRSAPLSALVGSAVTGRSACQPKAARRKTTRAERLRPGWHGRAGTDASLR